MLFIQLEIMFTISIPIPKPHIWEKAVFLNLRWLLSIGT